VNDKRKKLDRILSKLSKLIAHFGNANPHERVNALEKATALLHSVRLDWTDFPELLAAQQEPLLDLLSRLLEKPEDTLIRLALERASLFHSSERMPFADVVIDGHYVTWPLSDDEFSGWLLHQYFIERKKAPSVTALKAAIRTLSAHARFKGERHAVYQRVAEIDGTIFLDLGDEQGRAVEINQDGWQVVERSRVRFRRCPGMAAMPLPQRGGKIDDLHRFINLSATDFILYVTVILDAFRPGRPHPVLYLSGEEGSGKSAAAKIARELTDPSDAPLRTLPGTVRDLFVAVYNAQTVALDNVSRISPAISDALCQISSGSGFSTRKLYSDSGEFRVAGSRFIVMNGIANAITRPDLADRTVSLPTSPIRPEQRRSDVAFWNQFEGARSRILGALLDALVHGLRELPYVELSQKPRMADLALWGCAVEGAFAEAGDFMRAFTARAAEAVEVVVEEDCVATAVSALMIERDCWTGTAAQLLIELTNCDRTEAGVSGQKDWPKDPTRMSQRLRRQTATLRKAGIEVSFGKAPDRSRTRMVELCALKPMNELRPQAGRRQQQSTADAGGRSDAIQATGRVVAFPRD
jgi:hypothetical protein